MNRRRRWGILLGGAFVLIVLGVVLFGGRGSEPRVKLLFLRLNHSPGNPSAPGQATALTNASTTSAVFLITNTGRAAVRVGPLKTYSNLLGALKHGDWGYPVFPRVLKPGEVHLYEIQLSSGGKDFLADVEYTRYSVHDEWSNKAWSSGNAILSWIGLRLSRRREVRWADCQFSSTPPPSTNRPAGLD